MSKFQRRHYQLLAEVLAQSNAKKMVILQMMSMLRQDNHRFDDTRFINEIETQKAMGGHSGI